MVLYPMWGGNISNEPELLCDLTTTEYVSEVKWTQGDNEQVFDDYKEIFIKMMLQPTENNIRNFRISIEKNINAWSGKYGMRGPGDKLNFPSSAGYTKICFTHLKKSLFGIEEITRDSFNDNNSHNLLTLFETSTYLNDLTYGVINSPDKLPDISFPKHFEEISIGSYVANMPPNCRFMIYGIK